MDFASIVIFLVLYYIRPQEWIGFIQPLKPVTLSMAFALVAMLLRHRGLTARDFFKTPHDWLMLAYFLWLVGTAPSIRETFGEVYSLFLFYIVTVQALSKTERVQSFLNWWTVLIFWIAAVGVLSTLGFDPMGNMARTETWFKGRLVLTATIFSNPNAYGHSLVPVILMLYFVLVWRRPVFMKIFAIPLFVIPLYCIYLTYSKGAFLCGFATIVLAMTFGRPKVVQILVVLAAVTIGWASVTTLPRMGELNKTKSDEAIQGRIAAFEYGLRSMEEHTTGLGWGKFARSFFREHKYGKTPHSSFVQVGSELGYTGLILFLGILYCCLRTLVSAKTRNENEERIRRMLFAMVVAYMVSGWMVDFAYRAAFFLLVATVAAFHRQLVAQEAVQPERTEPESALAPAIVIEGLRPAPAIASAVSPAMHMRMTAVQDVLPPAEEHTIGEEHPAQALKWNRIGIFDVVIIIGMTIAAVKFWRYIIERF